MVPGARDLRPAAARPIAGGCVGLHGIVGMALGIAAGIVLSRSLMKSRFSDAKILLRLAIAGSGSQAIESTLDCALRDCGQRRVPSQRRSCSAAQDFRMSRTLPILSLAVLTGVPVWTAGTAARGEAVGPEPLPSEGPKPPWACRLDKTSRAHAGHGLGLVDLTLWDPEPDAPAPVKEEQFAPALNQLCSSDLSYQQSNQYAHWILEACQRFGVDPFLLASLVFQQSRCASEKKHPTVAIGLAGIDAAMHAPFLHNGRYSYWVREGQEWLPREVDVSPYLASLQALHQDRANIFFAAALMHAYQQQCPDIDGAFQSVPHRHYVSHMIWGDRVIRLTARIGSCVPDGPSFNTTRRSCRRGAGPLEKRRPVLPARRLPRARLPGFSVMCARRASGRTRASISCRPSASRCARLPTAGSSMPAWTRRARGPEE